MKLIRDERGLSLTEVAMASLVASILAAAFVVLFSSFNRTMLIQENRAAAMSQIRPTVETLLVDLRQAVDADQDGTIIEALNSSWAATNLVFHSDRFDDTVGPEEIRYFLDECSAGLCVLKRSVTPADSGSGPPWTYSGTASTTVLLRNVVSGGADPLFVGVDWTGGTEALVTACGSSPTCDFDLIRISLRVNPNPDLGGGLEQFIREEVRIRNAER